MTSIEEYPWINNIFQDIDMSNLPHASIIEGSKGLGKLLLAKKIAHEILCNSLDKASENLILNNSHPDLFINSDNTKILISEIRQLIDFSNLSSAISKAKVIILQNCENMNLESQNAILKQLRDQFADIAEKVNFSKLGLDLSNMNIGYVKWLGTTPTKIMQSALDSMPPKPQGDGWNTVYELKVYSVNNMENIMELSEIINQKVYNLLDADFARKCKRDLDQNGVLTLSNF
mgnify:CR=1 FL=1